jgi:hypothetical protein
MRPWLALSFVGALAAACTPALDWREVRDGNAGVVALFPCRPDRVERRVSLGGQPVSMRLLSCSAQGMTFAVGHVEFADPRRTGPALADLRAALLTNVAAGEAEPVLPSLERWQPPGSTAQPQAGRLAFAGRLPDGAPVRVTAAWFAHGLGAWQASVVGPAPDPAAVRTFFDGMRAGR